MEFSSIDFSLFLHSDQGRIKLVGNPCVKLWRTFSWLWLPVNDDYRNEWSAAECFATVITEWSPPVRQKEKIEKFAFRSNNTGRNSTKFWFIVFKTWSFFFFFFFFFGGAGGSLMWGPWGTCPKCPLVNSALIQITMWHICNDCIA